MYKDRKSIYQKLEKRRNTKLITYVTGDRRGLETQIHSEVLDFLVKHLDSIGETSKISLFLYTRGGNTLAAWSIANLIRQYCETFEVIVPSKAHSAGTLIALGANEIVMTKQATLGPIDPSVNTPLNPQVPGADPNARLPVSVEAINGFMELAKEAGVENAENLTSVLTSLSSQVHPLVLGQVFRARSQIKMLGRRLLAKHLNDEETIEKTISFLCSESGSHDYTIYRAEAKDELGLNVTEPDKKEYELIKSIYDDISDELCLSEPFNPQIHRAGEQEVKYNFTRALIESTEGGCYKYVSSGCLTRRQIIVDKTNNIVQEVTQDEKTLERWVQDEHV